MSQRKGNKKKVVSGLHQASKANPKPQPRVITAPDILPLPNGTAVDDLGAIGISATGIGNLYLAPSPPKIPKIGTYDVTVIAKSTDLKWTSASLSIQIVVMGEDRTLTGALTGTFKTGDTLRLPPAGLTLSEGPENYRVIAPPGGLFLKAGPTPVIIEAPAVGAVSLARWEGSVAVGKGQPEIKWVQVPPFVKGITVGDAKLRATITPATLAFTYNPVEGTQPDYGDITLTASRKADADYELATASITITIVGKSGEFDNPLDVDALPQKKATPDVGGLSTPDLAKAFARKTPDQVKNELNQIRGITASTRPGKSGKVTMLDVVDNRPHYIKAKDKQRLTAIEFHQGGGIHGKNPYVRVSTTQGKVKIVHPGYDPKNENPIETIYIKGP